MLRIVPLKEKRVNEYVLNKKNVTYCHTYIVTSIYLYENSYQSYT
jgi:hypothetical protein